MNYPDWELERQRLALWALLGGGQISSEKQRTHAALRAAEERSGGPDRRSAGKRRKDGRPAKGAPEEWGMVPETGGPHSSGENGGSAGPPDMEEIPTGGGYGPPGRGEVAQPENAAVEKIRNSPEETAGTTAERLGFPEKAHAAGQEESTLKAAAPAGKKRSGTDLVQPAGGGTQPGIFFSTAHPAGNRVIWTPSSDYPSSPWSGGETAALQAEDHAKALSRAVQRDARRYDGGFTIY